MRAKGRKNAGVHVLLASSLGEVTVSYKTKRLSSSSSINSPCSCSCPCPPRDACLCGPRSLSLSSRRAAIGSISSSFSSFLSFSLPNVTEKVVAELGKLLPPRSKVQNQPRFSVFCLAYPLICMRRDDDEGEYRPCLTSGAGGGNEKRYALGIRPCH
ncbi:hypothetical protein LZ30DRAFT_28153 [Colletotrichum cereale]|nr:hypothetical protein LZ30DRAFT_28153 [Colletotrichum cereale]